MSKPEISTCQRSARLDLSLLKDESREIELAFSSENKVRQVFGYEVLDHEDVDLEFLNSGRAPLLKDHDKRQQIGVIERAYIDQETRVGRAVVRFGRNALAESEYQDMKDGIRVNVSVSYEILEMDEELPRDAEGIPSYRVKFRPFEISLVSVPADESVGVGREKIQEEKPLKGVVKMSVQENDSAKVDVAAEVKSAREAEVSRVKEIHSLGERHKMQDLAQKAISEGLSVSRFKGEILERIQSHPVKLPQGEVDMSKKEQREYSLMKAINAAAKKDWGKAGLELEVSKELEKQYGREAKGFFVPTNIAWGNQASRDLTVASATGGAKLVGTDQRGDLYIDALRAKTLINELGATVLTGLQGDVDIPRVSVKTTVAFMANETTAVTEGAPQFDQIQLAPKTVSGFVDISRKLRYQSDPSVEMLVRNDILQQIASKIDDVAFEGGGTGEPSGIINGAGVAVVALGTNGAAPTYGSTIDLIKEVDVDNALMGNLAYVTTPAAWAKLAQTAKVASTDSVMILDPAMNMLNGYPIYRSNNVPSDLTKGSGTALSAMFFGNFNDLMLAFWSGIDIIVDESSLSTIGGVRLVFFQDLDVGLRHDESFAVIKDMITT